MSEKIVEKGYDKCAKEYHKARHFYGDTKKLNKFIKLLPKNAKILDVGCGAGVPVAKFLVNKGYEVTGIDFSKNMLDLAKKNVPGAKFLKKDMTKLTFKPASFDAITAFNSIIHVPREKHKAIFENFNRMLKPNGILLVSMGSDCWEGTEEYCEAKLFWSQYAPKKSLRLIKESGFEIISDKLEESHGEKSYWIFARKT